MESFVIVFALGVAQCYALTSGAIVFARHWRLLDWPDKDRKCHDRATPLMGGVAVMGALFLGVLECYVAGWEWIAVEERSTNFTMMLLNSAFLLCAIGLWDDKYGMRARTKFLLQIAAIIPYVWWGRATTAVNVFGWELQLAWLGVPLTLLWLVSCANFVNLVDGLDGLASTVSLVVSLTVAVLAYLTGQTGILCVAVILSGAIIGFLCHNWPPARIFLGDSGSLPLGFLVGALAVEASVKKAAGLTFAVPLVLLSVPMFDTSMAILRRKLNGRKIGQGDRAHIHHLLRDRGLTPTQTLLAIGSMCVGTATAAVLATIYHNDLIAIALCGGLLALLVFSRVFGFHEIVLLARHVQAAWLFLLSVPQALRWRFLLARLVPNVAERRLECWKQMVKRVKRMHGLSLEFTCRQRSTRQVVAGLYWISENEPVTDSPEWELRHTVIRDDGLLATVVARGEMPGAAQPLRLNELLELFAAFSAHCPIDDEIRVFDGDRRHAA